MLKFLRFLGTLQHLYIVKGQGLHTLSHSSGNCFCIVCLFLSFLIELLWIVLMMLLQLSCNNILKHQKLCTWHWAKVAQRWLVILIDFPVLGWPLLAVCDIFKDVHWSFQKFKRMCWRFWKFWKVYRDDSMKGRERSKICKQLQISFIRWDCKTPFLWVIRGKSAPVKKLFKFSAK